MSDTVRCPAALEDRGMSSVNELDVRCRLSGMLRDADRSPCCGEYTRCAIWRREKENIFAGRQTVRKNRMMNSGTGKWVSV